MHKFENISLPVCVGGGGWDQTGQYWCIVDSAETLTARVYDQAFGEWLVEQINRQYVEKPDVACLWPTIVTLPPPDTPMVISARCPRCYQLTQVNAIVQPRPGGYLKYGHRCDAHGGIPYVDMVSAAVDLVWTCGGPCKRTFISTEEGLPDSEGCGHATCYDCLRILNGVCPRCGADHVNPKLPVQKSSWYDYFNNAWVHNGVYVACKHVYRCRCYARLHAGQAPAPQLITQYGLEPTLMELGGANGE